MKNIFIGIAILLGIMAATNPSKSKHNTTIKREVGYTGLLVDAMLRNRTEYNNYIFLSTVNFDEGNTLTIGAFGATIWVN